ncbi:MAG TPA: helix-turn-helix domain-containing protein [Solirubrobacterales bacterium]|nr:helix-turn-helix domain-containing protein [Solirubrobacterales bacterium]
MATQNRHSPASPLQTLENGILAAQNGHSSSSSGQSPQGESIPVDWERLARATAHPLRVSILEILGIDGGRVLSPNDLSHELQIPLSNTNYHVTELAKSNLIELVRERQVRGATEHFYRLPTEGEADRSEEGERGTSAEEEARHPVAA